MPEVVVAPESEAGYLPVKRSVPKDMASPGRRPHRPPWTLAEVVDRHRNGNWEAEADDTAKSYQVVDWGAAKAAACCD